MQHFLSKETFMTRGDTHDHENNKVFSYQSEIMNNEQSENKINGRF